MNWDLAQHAVVTLAAIGALTIIVREVAGFLRPGTRGPSCSQCASAPRARDANSAPAAGRETTLLQIQRRR